ncbi:hypothetical protein EVG20_g4540 [Dentipellis fragilis]|uniref:Uncharacterized protein n=1 Tax=Dentipellis fragilis TaxID=205917 RepID=A0A4Y9YZK0_9AGAM|nr:hypothetical protein EVG20_g4540 [Dentipellis fragilis]
MLAPTDPSRPVASTRVTATHRYSPTCCQRQPSVNVIVESTIRMSSSQQSSCERDTVSRHLFCYIAIQLQDTHKGIFQSLRILLPRLQQDRFVLTSKNHHRDLLQSATLAEQNPWAGSSVCQNRTRSDLGRGAYTLFLPIPTPQAIICRPDVDGAIPFQHQRVCLTGHSPFAIRAVTSPRSPLPEEVQASPASGDALFERPPRAERRTCSLKTVRARRFLHNWQLCATTKQRRPRG